LFCTTIRSGMPEEHLVKRTRQPSLCHPLTLEFVHFGWRWTWLTARAGCPTADISPGHYRTRLLRDQPCHQRLGRCELLPVLFVMEVL
jgi:hypothetical protein